MQFSGDGKILFLTAGDLARVKVFAFLVPPTPAESTTDPELSNEYLTPHVLTTSGAAQGIQPLSGGRLVFTRSSLTSPNDVFVLRGLPASGAAIDVSKTKVEQLTKFTEDALAGKTLTAGEDFWFQGAKHKIQGWIVKPPGFKEGEKKKHPILLFIHGGPQGAWEDQWSTRWNPQGTSVQCILRILDSFMVRSLCSAGLFRGCDQPHWFDNLWSRYAACLGSVQRRLTTFAELTDDIRKDWGGKPFVDLREGWRYVLDHYPEVDSDRAVAAGASWGGYAIKYVPPWFPNVDTDYACPSQKLDSRPP